MCTFYRQIITGTFAFYRKFVQKIKAKNFKRNNNIRQIKAQTQIHCMIFKRES